MNDFFRFPHTPHIAWLGKEPPRDDKILPFEETQEILSGPVTIEEKVDGANLGLSLGANGQFHAQNRGHYLTAPYSGQFARLTSWLVQNGDALSGNLDENLILFGEWCAARHSLDYTRLPDWFLLFDVYDQAARKFWSTNRRNDLAQKIGLENVPALYRGKVNLNFLKQYLSTTPSRYRDGELEGLVIRKDSLNWCEARAKLVRPEFTQAIESHWSKRGIEWNRIDYFREK